jgi:hypothetical protein
MRARPHWNEGKPERGVTGEGHRLRAVCPCRYFFGKTPVCFVPPKNT